MANQKITELSGIQKLTRNDLFVVVDVNENSPNGTPTGLTKHIPASQLAQDLIDVGAGKVGIKFSGLSDTPDNYLGKEGSFLRVSPSINSATGEPDGLEFIDSPGASEHSFNLEEHFDTTQSFSPGSLVRRSYTGKFVLASSSTEEDAECIGIIKKIKPTSDGLTQTISLVFGGYMEFPELVNIQKRSDAETTTVPTALVNGEVYFLGTNGSLANFDPASTSVDGITSHVSKPLFIALGRKSGAFVNYRGLQSPEDEEHNLHILEYITSCSDLKVGDVVRVRKKTEIDGTPLGYIDSRSSILNVGGETNICLASAKYFEESDVLGLVIESTPDYFKIQTDGMVAFKWLDDDGNQQKIFETGYQYFLDDVPSSDGVWMDSVRPTIFDPIDNPLIPLIGPDAPFRNSTISDPFRRTATGHVDAYSRPVFYAISENKILITNHRTYPVIADECDRCTSLQGEVTSSLSGVGGVQTTVTKRYFTYDSFASTEAIGFLTKIWPEADPDSVAVLYNSDGQSGTWTYVYGLGWNLEES
jgi:hypothetical protein